MVERVTQNVSALLDQADHAARTGQAAQATALYQRVLGQAPENPRALNALGSRALSAGDAQTARELLRRAVRSDPRAAPIWLNLSAAERLCGSAQGELEALDGALSADPYFVIALLHKAQWFERHGREADAAGAYRSLLQAAPPIATLPEAMRKALEHGQALIDRRDRAVETAIRDELGSAVEASPRFQQALEVIGGRRKVYWPRPVGLHYPYLPPDEFFDPARFPWFDDIEAAAPTIREELLALVGGGDYGSPYVSIAPGTPQNQWQGLNNSLDWSAIFLWKNGVAQTDVLARCPSTAALLASIPMFDVPDRGPTAMFSTLRPHAHIPPHHGVTNIRTVVHLPLIVPSGCEFRVGSQIRMWEEGVAWAFDDTIEHEAWNRSQETRVILIIDAWNPYLDNQERELLRRADPILSSAAGTQT